jgi:hypothetical protein
MKLGISSEDLQDLILIRLDLTRSMSSSQGAGKANPKLGANLNEKTS